MRETDLLDMRDVRDVLSEMEENLPAFEDQPEESASPSDQCSSP